MGIQVEFNPDLALRNISEFEKGNRKEEECVPKVLEENKEYSFLKKGQRNYYMLDDEPIPLVQTNGEQTLSKPLAAIRIVEATHFNLNGEIWTKGKYKIIRILNKGSKSKFIGFQFEN